MEISTIYEYMYYLILIINIFMVAEVAIQIRKFLFIKKYLTNNYKSIPNVTKKLRASDLFIIGIWILFAGRKFYSFMMEPYYIVGNLDVLLIIFAVLATIDRIVSVYISIGFLQPAVTFFYSDNGIIISNPNRKLTEFAKIYFLSWDNISKITLDIFELTNRTWKLVFFKTDNSSYYIILDDSSKNEVKKMLEEKEIKISDRN